jgi:hypothetical protein
LDVFVNWSAAISCPALAPPWIARTPMAVQVECSTGAMAVELAVVGAAEVVVAAVVVVVVVVTAGVLGAAAVDAATDADDGTDALMTGLSARPAVELVHPPTSAATVTAPATIAERLTGRSADRSSTAGSRP